MCHLPIFERAIAFEVCISQSYQALELLATASKLPVFDKKDGSKEKRLYQLYIQSKHMDRMIEGGQIPTQATAALWITNEGIECSGSALSFEELIALFKWITEAADQIARFELGKEA